MRPTRRSDAAARMAREMVRNDCFDRLRDELGDRFDETVAARLRAVAGDVGRDGLGLDDEGRLVLASCDVVVHSAATVAFDAPLDTAVEVNLLGPSRVAAAIESLAGTRRARAPRGATHPSRHGVHRLRGRHPPGGRHRDARHRGAARRERGPAPTPPSPPRSTSTPRSTRPGACATTSNPRRARRNASPSSPRRHAPSSARPGRTCWPNGPRSCATSGSGPSSSSADGPAPRRSAGPTPTPSPRPWASAPSSARAPECPSRSCDRRSSSRRWPSHARGGSGASGWPSPSSSPTGGGCCRNSRASPKGS